MRSNSNSLISLLRKMFRWDILVGIFSIFGAIYTIKSFYKESSDESPINVIISEGNNIESTTDLIAEKRQRLLERFKGKYSYLEPGGLFNYVYCLELDPINSKAKWISEDIQIKNSKGYCGTEMRWPEAWEVINFSVNEKDNSAIATLVSLTVWEDFPKNDLCSVKLSFDEYDRIKMQYIEGPSAPSILCGENDQYTNIAVFSRADCN